MRSSELELRIGALDKRLITEHLKASAQTFVPDLSSYVDIGLYAERLSHHALIFSYFSNGKAVALLAGYFDRAEQGVMFISNLSVVLSEQGNGLASNLLELAQRHAFVSGFKRIELEVFKSNVKAVDFYLRKGFERSEIKEGRYRMVKELISA